MKQGYFVFRSVCVLKCVRVRRRLCESRAVCQSIELASNCRRCQTHSLSLKVELSRTELSCSQFRIVLIVHCKWASEQQPPLFGCRSRVEKNKITDGGGNKQTVDWTFTAVALQHSTHTWVKVIAEKKVDRDFPCRLLFGQTKRRRRYCQTRPKSQCPDCCLGSIRKMKTNNEKASEHFLPLG